MPEPRSSLPMPFGWFAVRRTGDFAPGTAFDLRVVDGVVPCRVEGEGAPLASGDEG